MNDIEFSLSALEADTEETRSPLALLRRFSRVRPVARTFEKCELCASRLPANHHHLVDRRTRRLVCCCEPCGVLFSSGQSALYRRVPQDIRALPDFRITDFQWENLLIPINLAFFYSPEEKGVRSIIGPENSSDPFSRKMVAVYPSPAGPIESLLGLEAWEAIVDDNRVLRDLQPEVEALLVNRLSGKHLHYLVPIDECYRLSGLIRVHWRGLSGGSEVWEEVSRYFDRLKEKSCST